MKVIVKVNGKDISKMTDEERRKISEKLNTQILLAAGYRIKKK